MNKRESLLSTNLNAEKIVLRIFSQIRVFMYFLFSLQIIKSKGCSCMHMGSSKLGEDELS